MAEPVTTTALPLVVTQAGLMGLVAMALGVPSLTVICAVVGATVAVAQSGRVAWSARGIASAVLSFALSLLFALAGAHFLGLVLVGALGKLIALPAGSADPLLALLLGLLGQSVILPALSKRLGAEIETRGIQ